MHIPECLGLNLHEMSREMPGESSRPYAHSSGARSHVRTDVAPSLLPLPPYARAPDLTGGSAARGRGGYAHAGRGPPGKS